MNPDTQYDEITLALATDDELYEYLNSVRDWSEKMTESKLAIMLGKPGVRARIVERPFYLMTHEVDLVSKACRVVGICPRIQMRHGETGMHKLYAFTKEKQK